MDFITKDDNTKMATNDWHRYLGEVVMNVTPARGTSFEWNKIKTKVKNVDGDTTHGTQIHRHYVPYLAIRESLEKQVDGHSRGDACEMLNNHVIALYSHSQIFPITDLQPPPKNGAVKDSLTDSWNLQTRAATSAWINWVLEAICDFPDNIFYGPGTGDGAGTLVDVPNGSKKGEQLVRVMRGASLLRSVVRGPIEKLVDANGEKL